jgi:hypothetical protein
LSSESLLRSQQVKATAPVGALNAKWKFLNKKANRERLAFF